LDVRKKCGMKTNGAMQRQREIRRDTQRACILRSSIISETVTTPPD